MPSAAHQVLQQGLQEVTDLLKADPTPKGKLPSDPALSRAVLRSAVVILCSHFERYLRSVNEEAVTLLNVSSIDKEVIPDSLRLEHSRSAIDLLAQTQWKNRASGLRDFLENEAWLWGAANKGKLDHTRIVQWMKSPMPKEIRRFYRNWGIEDVFTSITRTIHTKQRLFLKITELVEKRHNIAHGDFSTEATASELQEYQSTVKVFGDRADRLLSRRLHGAIGIDCKWY